MTISFRILETEKQITKNINLAIAEVLTQKIRSRQNWILAELIKVVPSWIKAQPEIQSLQSYSTGSLVALFGIPGDTSSIIESICSSVANSISLKFTPFKANLDGGLEIYFQPSNFANLLALPDGRVNINNGELHWLDWLLTKGDTIIIANYSYNPQTGLGRSNLGNMLPGGAFRIPPQFSGTDTDNFITRALLGSDQERTITTIIQRALA